MSIDWRQVRRARLRLQQELGLTKAASFGDYFAQALAAAAVGAAINTGSKLLGHLGGAVVGRRQKEKAFEAMLVAAPELRRANQAKVRRNFDTLFRFAPEMAMDPNVAASFVRNTLEYDVIDHRTVMDLIQASSMAAKRDASRGSLIPSVRSITINPHDIRFGEESPNRKSGGSGGKTDNSGGKSRS